MKKATGRLYYKEIAYLSPETIEKLGAAAASSGTSPSEVVEALVKEHLGEYSSKGTSFVEFILKPGRRNFDEPAWEEGGRWLLEWFLRTEPDWQKKHTVMLPRHWPIPFDKREYRCYENGGDPRSILDYIRELKDPVHPGEEPYFPADLPLPTLEEWLEVVRRFKGCCGEKLRSPSGEHWAEICS